ncbi:MAG: hypothetical protein OXC62_16120 [Aestuariivita sp.]|nr:hypothetical protein [Aestuariivita sp.]
MSRLSQKQTSDHSTRPVGGCFWDAIPSLCRVLNAEIERNLVLLTLDMPDHFEQRFHGINRMLRGIVWHLEDAGSFSTPVSVESGDVVQFPGAGPSSSSPAQPSLGIPRDSEQREGLAENEPTMDLDRCNQAEFPSQAKLLRLNSGPPLLPVVSREDFARFRKMIAEGHDHA